MTRADLRDQCSLGDAFGLPVAQFTSLFRFNVFQPGLCRRIPGKVRPIQGL